MGPERRWYQMCLKYMDRPISFCDKRYLVNSGRARLGIGSTWATLRTNALLQSLGISLGCCWCGSLYPVRARNGPMLPKSCMQSSARFKAESYGSAYPSKEAPEEMKDVLHSNCPADRSGERIEAKTTNTETDPSSSQGRSLALHPALG